ncbi:unnamed protein product [Phaedon cochleariae]|uniref:Peptidase S1 domain-containing protein n=1 Tax=Phaedon cochleariae TaxID=80249 RepID=A0A9P0DSS0_PHACE|nr:unnamed protein product [Phaedon cochleariae]
MFLHYYLFFLLYSSKGFLALAWKPYQVAIFSPTGITRPNCYGALISEEWVLTPKNCLGEMPSRLVFGGMQKRNQRVMIIRTRDQFYNFESPLNVMFVKLEKPVALNSNIEPILISSSVVQEADGIDKQKNPTFPPSMIRNPANVRPKISEAVKIIAQNRPTFPPTRIRESIINGSSEAVKIITQHRPTFPPPRIRDPSNKGPIGIGAPEAVKIITKHRPTFPPSGIRGPSNKEPIRIGAPEAVKIITKHRPTFPPPGIRDPSNKKSIRIDTPGAVGIKIGPRPELPSSMTRDPTNNLPIKIVPPAIKIKMPPRPLPPLIRIKTKTSGVRSKTRSRPTFPPSWIRDHPSEEQGGNSKPTDNQASERRSKVDQVEPVHNHQARKRRDLIDVFIDPLRLLDEPRELRRSIIELARRSIFLPPHRPIKIPLP